MGSPFETAKSAILGSTFDPIHKPDPLLTVQAFSEFQTQLEASQSGALVKATLVDLNAMTEVSEPSIMAWVTNDEERENNGIYENTGTADTPAWTRRTSIPQFVVAAINSGAGTANAIQADTDVSIPTENGRCLIILNITVDNTDTTTVSFNGGSPLTIKNISNALMTEGALKANMIVCGFISNNEFKLISDTNSASIAVLNQTNTDVNDIVVVPERGDADLDATLFVFVAVGTNTGAMRLDIGGGWVDLQSSEGVDLTAGMVRAGKLHFIHKVQNKYLITTSLDTSDVALVRGYMEQAAASAAASGAPFTSRSSFIAATIAAPVVQAHVITNGNIISYVKDIAGTAATTADGANWSPLGTITPDHFGNGSDEAVHIQAALDYLNVADNDSPTQGSPNPEGGVVELIREYDTATPITLRPRTLLTSIHPDIGVITYSGSGFAIVTDDDDVTEAAQIYRKQRAGVRGITINSNGSGIFVSAGRESDITENHINFNTGGAVEDTVGIKIKQGSWWSNVLRNRIIGGDESGYTGGIAIQLVKEGGANRPNANQLVSNEIEKCTFGIWGEGAYGNTIIDNRTEMVRVPYVMGVEWNRNKYFGVSVEGNWPSNIYSLQFTDGSTLPVKGDTVTGSTSGATAPVIHTSIKSGSISGSDATGFIQIGVGAGAFSTGENLQINNSTVAVLSTVRTNHIVIADVSASCFENTMIGIGTHASSAMDWCDPENKLGRIFGNVEEDETNFVTQTGTTANGSWVKHANGNLECRHRINLGSIASFGSGSNSDPYRTNITDWTFPESFLTAPNVQITTIIGGNPTASEKAVMTTCEGTTSTIANDIQAFRSTNVGTANLIEVDLFATGRWK